MHNIKLPHRTLLYQAISRTAHIAYPWVFPAVHKTGPAPSHSGGREKCQKEASTSYSTISIPQISNPHYLWLARKARYPPTNRVSEHPGHVYLISNPLPPVPIRLVGFLPLILQPRRNILDLLPYTEYILPGKLPNLLVRRSSLHKQLD
jgi:hypothetical protein